MFELFGKGSTPRPPRSRGPDQHGDGRMRSVRHRLEARPARAGTAAPALIAATLVVLAACALSLRASSAAQRSSDDSPATAPINSQQFPAPPAIKQQTGDSEGPALTAKQKQELLKSNFEKMKHDADALAALAKSLQQDLGKSSENVLSLKVLDQADKIEKLARKIKTEAKGE